MSDELFHPGGTAPPHAEQPSASTPAQGPLGQSLPTPDSAAAGGGGGPQRNASCSEGPPPPPAAASPPPLHHDAVPPPPWPPQPPDEELVDLYADFLNTELDEPPPEGPVLPATDLGCSWPPLASGRRGRSRRLVPKDQPKAPTLTPQQRLLLLDIWQRSGLPAGDFAALVGISKFTLYAWKKKFDSQGPAGLLDQPKGGPRGSQLSDLTQRTILLLKQSHPDWGCQKISDMLLRGPALPASPQAVARVLHEAGYVLHEAPTQPHADTVRRFERARPNQLWQTDLFSFVLKRQNRRVYLVAFMDDHSRFVVGYGLHASQGSALVLEVLRAALTSYGRPEEVLTDNGSQYVTWRGTSAFTKELQRQGIKQVVASPRRPQTLGKIERFWGTLWRECVQAAVFLDLGDARQRIGWFIDHYNFQRPHQGIDGSVPADRFFGAEQAVRQALEARVAANALALARDGLPKEPFYLTGQVGGQSVSVHAEGQRVILTAEGNRREVELTPPPAPRQPLDLPGVVCPAGVVAGTRGDEPPPPPASSPLDDAWPELAQALAPGQRGPANAPGPATSGTPAANATPAPGGES